VLQFTFQISQQDGDPLVRIRALPDEDGALTFARQLQTDWADSEMIDVLLDGRLCWRLRRSAPPQG
jgi:hypothetical protein